MNLLRDLNEKQIARWEKARAKGKAAYVIRTSLFWWFGFNGFMSAFNWFWGSQPFNWPLIIASLVLCPLVGYSAWWGSEGSYQNTLQNRKILKGLEQ
jgi:hypothetical protein